MCFKNLDIFIGNQLENISILFNDIIASLKNIMVVKRLPKTRSGKILRKLIRTMLDGKEFQIPSTIDDEKIVEEIQIKINEYRNN